MPAHPQINDTIFYWFSANDTAGSGNDGASAVFDVREGGATASNAPIMSGNAMLLTHANYSAGCYEVEIAVTVANGFAADKSYGVFSTLAVDGQNPTGFIGDFVTSPVQAQLAAGVVHQGKRLVFANDTTDTTLSVTNSGGPSAEIYSTHQGSLGLNIIGGPGGYGAAILGGYAGEVGGQPGRAGLRIVGGDAWTGGGETAGPGVEIIGGLGAATGNPAAPAVSYLAGDDGGAGGANAVEITAIGSGKSAIVLTPGSGGFGLAGTLSGPLSALATDSVDAAALKADAVTEIQAGLATAAALATISNIVNAGDTTSKTADSGDIISSVGTVISGTFASTTSDDAGYWITAPVGTAVGGFTLRQSLVFDLPMNRVPVAFYLNGYWNGSAKVADVYALNNVTGVYDKLTSASTQLTSRSGDLGYTIPLPRDYSNDNGTNAIVTMELRATSTNTSHRLRIDQALVYHVAEAGIPIAPPTPTQIWSNPVRTLTVPGTEPAGAPTTAEIVAAILAKAALTVRDLSAVADADLTIEDMLVAALAGAVGDKVKSGTTFTIKTPAGTTVAAKTLDSATNPTSST